MILNCKPGQLAIIIKSEFHPQDIGKIVEVVSVSDGYEDSPGVFFWQCLSERPLSCKVYIDGEYYKDGYANELDIADECLRPVSGLDEEDNTQTEEDIVREKEAV